MVFSTAYIRFVRSLPVEILLLIFAHKGQSDRSWNIFSKVLAKLEKYKFVKFQGCLTFTPLSLG